MQNNYSYHAIIAVFLQTMWASNRGAYPRLGVQAHNVAPRQNIEHMEKSGKFSANLIAKLKRREAAHQNCFESLGLFCAAVVAGNQAGLSGGYMTKMSALFFLLRCGYLWTYLNISSDKASYIRSLFWWSSAFCYLTTFWKAGNALNAKVF